MKNTALIILVALLAFSTVGHAQEKGRRAFVFAGAGWTPNKDLSYSFEVGTWGITKPTSFSLTYDIMVNVGGGDHKYSHWVGIKPYFTFYAAKKVNYMFYFAPKLSLSDKDVTLIEFGINPNYTLSDDFLLSTTIGTQAYQGSPLNPFVSAGLIYLFKNK